MTGCIIPGFNFHPQWVNRSGFSPFIQPLIHAGLSALEFELDPHIQDWQKTLGYMEEAAGADLKFSFHAPYRSPYSLAGFEHGKKHTIITDYAPMLKIAQDWANRLKVQPVVVIHGARADNQDRQVLFQDTCGFLNWVLDEFRDIRLAFENNTVAEAKTIKIGDTIEEVSRVVDTIHDPRLGICWDMGHYAMAGFTTPPDGSWLQKVIHVHIHDLDAAHTDHFPLVFASYDYTGWLGALAAAGMQGIATLEVKGGQLMKWPNEQIEEALCASFTCIKEAALCQQA